MAQEVLSQPVSYQREGKTIQAYMSRPGGGGPWPAIVVIHEWWGLEEHIKDVTRRFAREGFVALAPDLYEGRVATEREEAQRLRSMMDTEQAVLDILAAFPYLKSQAFVNGKLAVIGYCMGGALSLLTACRAQELHAAIVYYGRNPDPIDQVQNIPCPLLGIYGERDQSIPPSEVERLKQALDRYGKSYEVHVYPGADHAFFNDTKERYHPEASRDAWGKTLNFLRRHLV